MVLQEYSPIEPVVHCLSMPADFAERLQVELSNRGCVLVCHQDSESLRLSCGNPQHGCVVIYNWSDGRESIELIRQLRTQPIPVQIVLVVVEAVAPIIARAAHAGATEVLSGTQSLGDLVEAIDRLIEMDRIERPTLNTRVELLRRLESLSDGERQVLQMVLDGMPNKVIASRLDVSQRTVEARRHKLFLKTQTNSIAELVRMVVQLESYTDLLTQ